jgi:glycogen synthase
MREDWSWEQSAKRYMEVFDRTLHSQAAQR